jgi:hypothetical protein
MGITLDNRHFAALRAAREARKNSSVRTLTPGSATLAHQLRARMRKVLS